MRHLCYIIGWNELLREVKMLHQLNLGGKSGDFVRAFTPLSFLSFLIYNHQILLYSNYLVYLHH